MEKSKYTNETTLKEIIPPGVYCYTSVDHKTRRVCPFWRGHYISASFNREPEKATMRLKEDGYAEHEIEIDRYPLYNGNCNSPIPKYEIGECLLLHISDLDHIGLGLLWDQCKKCSINVEESETGLNEL
jgi:hypothetical protein